MKVKKKIFISGIIFSIIPALITLIAGIISVNDLGRKLVDENIALMTEVKAANINTYLMNTKNSVNSVFEHINVNNLQSTNYFDSIWEEAQNKEVGIMDITCIDNTGRIIACTDKTKLGQPYPYKLTTEMDTAVISKLEPNLNYFSVYKRVENAGQEFYFIANIFQNKIDQIISSGTFSKNSYSYLLQDQTTKIGILGPESSIEAIFTEGVTDFEKKYSALDFAKRNDYFEYTFNGTKHLAFYSVLSINSWVMISAIPESSIAIYAKAEVTNQAMVFGIVAMVACVLLIILGFLIVLPIKTILWSVDRLCEEKYDVVCDYVSRNEFGQLASGINEISNIINKRDAEIKRQRDKYKVVTNNMKDIVYEYDINDNKFIVDLTKWNKAFNMTVVNDYAGMIKEYKKKVFSEDWPEFSEKLGDLKNIIDSNKDKIICEYRIINHEGHYIWVRTTTIKVKDAIGKVNKIIGIISNINEKKQKEAEYLRRSRLDALTGLYNKEYTQYQIIEYLKGEGKDGQHALITFDLDNFKGINDLLGHQFGDKVLIHVAKKISEVAEPTDIAGRMGGDEYVLLFKNINEEMLEQKADKLVEALKETVREKNIIKKISGSVGIAMFPQFGNTYEELFQKADYAMYCAKQKGKNNYFIYNIEVDRAKLLEDNFAKEVQEKIEKGDIFLEYYPVYSSDTKKVVGYEYLEWDYKKGYEHIPKKNQDRIIDKFNLNNQATYAYIAQAMKAISQLGDKLNKDKYVTIKINDIVSKERSEAEDKVLTHMIMTVISEQSKQYNIKNKKILISISYDIISRLGERAIDVIRWLKSNNYVVEINNIGEKNFDLHYITDYGIDYIALNDNAIEEAAKNRIHLNMLRYAVYLAGEVGVTMKFKYNEEVANRLVDFGDCSYEFYY